MTLTPEAPTPTTRPTTRMLWLDLTRKCQLACTHCYNASGPDGDHGTMTRADWLSVVEQAAAGGVELIQLIGGEPTLHPDALAVADCALGAGMEVEVYSNLVRVPNAWWALLARPGARLATSYYAADPAAHNAMTGRPSHARTRDNIAKAVARGVSLRVGVVVPEGSDATDAVRDLEALGVERVGVDRVRPFGRGAEQDSEPCVDGLCGHCGQGRAAIGPEGTVTPCIMSSWMATGDAREEPLADILAGPRFAAAAEEIRHAHPRAARGCDPDDDDNCDPDNSPGCDPDHWCRPGGPGSGCGPRS
ncbi:radical SAM protein [Nocardiopsis coralliicola]